MPLNFSTKRDPNAGLLPPGIYRFVVEAAEEKQGPKGAYAKLRLRPIVKGSKWSSSVWDNLSGSESAKFRVDAFMDSVGAADEPGTVGLSWFPGKTGWAKFGIETGNDGVDRPNVTAYLTAEQAEKQLEKMSVEAAMDNDSMELTTERRSRPAPEPAARPSRSKGKAGANVAELEAPLDDDIPF